ncbi:MAG: C4-type zinc ribbon domain-containing protein [Olsenella sp.]|nr:C4-type zinc ribbon domain-containing protein [Olsenella sp.]
MSESQALLRLQEIDLQLMRDSHALRQMPQQKRLAALAQAKKKLKSELQKIVGQRKDAQMELDDNEERHIRLLQIMDEVREKAQESGYRGVGDIESQLTSLAKKVEKLEFAHGELQASLGKLEKAEANARALAERLDREGEELEASYKRDSADIMARVRELARERKAVLAQLSPHTAQTYDEKSKRFGGLAVERLQGNVPSVCRVKLQPSQYGDLRSAGEPIAECPYCHRMLVVEGALDAE